MKVFLCLPICAITVVADGVAEASQQGGHGGSSTWPFIFQVVNFLLLLFVLYKYALPTVKSFFAERSQKIRQSLKEAEDAKTLAEEKLNGHEEKLRSLGEEVEKIRDLLIKEGQAEKDRIIRGAEKDAESIKKQAKVIAEQEIEKAKKDLRREMARLSLDRAEKIIRDNISDDDQVRFTKDYITQIATPS